MLGILETSAVPENFRILIDRRSAAHPTMSFVAGMVNFFAPTKHAWPGHERLF